jgi:hypothetical protein
MKRGACDRRLRAAGISEAAYGIGIAFVSRLNSYAAEVRWNNEMIQELDDVEIRVLGVLIEKSLTQPNGYPMTINAIRLGANQLQNREPTMNLTDGDVSRALQTLHHKNLAGQAPPNPGDRSNKFRHRVVEAFHWDPREQAVMAELLLRGRQTSGELRSRASRMAPLQDLESVIAILGGLRRTDAKFVEELPREPGRSANRFRHLLGGSQIVETQVAASEAASAPAAVVAKSTAAPVVAVPPDVFERLSTLEAQVAYLMRTVAELQEHENAKVDVAAESMV